MKKAMAFIACVGLAAVAAQGQIVHVSVQGTVEWNQFNMGAFVGAHAGDAASMEFNVDASAYTDNPVYPTRGYPIIPESFRLQVGDTSVGLLLPLSAQPYFVLRDNDPGVDGFFISTNLHTDNEILLDMGVANYGIAFARTFSSRNVLPSRDILQALGSWQFEFMSSYNWTVQRGEFSTPLGIGYQSITISLAPPQSTCETADFDCDGDTGTDADISSFFLCLAGTCPDSPCTNSADFDGDGDVATDADIEAFFRVLAGLPC